jgi:hypothetical protein
MADVKKTYAADGTLDQLQTTCRGDEDAERARLAGFRRVQRTDGTKGTEATFAPVPNNQPFPTKEIFFFDVTSTTPDQERNIMTQQLQQGHALVVDKPAGAVYLNNKEAAVWVFREQ